MLRIRRRQLGKERTDSPRLADDFLQRFRAQKLHDRLREVYLIHFFQFLALFRRLRTFDGHLLLVENLQADVLHIVLMVFFELFRDFFFDLIFQRAPRHHVGDTLGKRCDELRYLRIDGNMLDGRVFHDDTLERQHPLPAQRRAHEAHGVHFPRLNDQFIRAENIRQHPIQSVDLAVESILLPCRGSRLLRRIPPAEKFEQISHYTFLSPRLIRRRCVLLSGW